MVRPLPWDYFIQERTHAAYLAYLAWCEPQRKDSTRAGDYNAAGYGGGGGPVEAAQETMCPMGSYTPVIQTQISQFLKPVFFSLYHSASRGVNLIQFNKYLLSIC